METQQGHFDSQPLPRIVTKNVRLSRTLRIFLPIIPLSAGVFSQNIPLFTENASLVTVPCVVSDSRGRPVDDLRADDFRLYVDGAPRKIDNLWRDPDLPLLLGVINDVSDSQKPAYPKRITRSVNRSGRLFMVRTESLWSQSMTESFSLRT